MAVSPCGRVCPSAGSSPPRAAAPGLQSWAGRACGTATEERQCRGGAGWPRHVPRGALLVPPTGAGRRVGLSAAAAVAAARSARCCVSRQRAPRALPAPRRACPKSVPKTHTARRSSAGLQRSRGAMGRGTGARSGLRRDLHETWSQHPPPQSGTGEDAGAELRGVRPPGASPRAALQR